MVPNKRQCNFLKGKFGNVRGKQATKKTSPVTTAAKLKDGVKLGAGRGGKNLALIKQQLDAAGELSSSPEHKLNDPRRQQQHVDENKAQPEIVKRKLNLEEYKKRKMGEDVSSTDKPIVNKTFKHSEEVTAIVKSLKEQQQSVIQSTKPIVLPTSVKTISPSQNAGNDPITLAKNKVLRMQELKRAQQLKIIDSTVSAKVARVTKLLPLKEMVKDTYCAKALVDNGDGDEKQRLQTTNSNSDYEEIIIVSSSCNTVISIPPLAVTAESVMMQHLSNGEGNASRSLLKSAVNLSRNSLLASIQNVMVQKRVPAVGEVASGSHGEDKVIMHLRKDRLRSKNVKRTSTQTDFLAEFPPLMLWPSSTSSCGRASRPRRKRQTANISAALSEQGCTGSEEEEEEHQMTGVASSVRSSSYRSTAADEDSCASSTERAVGYSSRSTRRHRSSVSSSYSDSERTTTTTRRQRRTSYKQRRAKKRGSRSGSSSSTSSSDSRSTSGAHRGRMRSRSRSPFGYNDRSSSHTSWRQHNNTNYANRNVSQPAVEERRIVYVGRIEEETTKDMLRRKFLAYGNIKQITIHYKQTG